MSLKRLIPSQRAYAAALQMLGKNVGDTVDIFDSMANVVGKDVEVAFSAGSDTMERTMAQAMGKLSAAAVELGDNLTWVVDMAGDAASGVAGAAHSFNQLGDHTKTLAMVLISSAAAIGPILYGLGSLARVSARFTGLSILFKAAWIQKVASMVMGTNAAVALEAKMKVLGVTTGQLAGGIIAAGIAGYSFGKWLDGHFGITKSINEEYGRFGDAVTTVGEAFAANEDQLITYTGTVRNLAMKIGEAGLAMELTRAQQAGDAKEISRIGDLIEKQAAAYNKLNIKVDGVTEAKQKAIDQDALLKEQQDQWLKDEEARIDALQKEYDLMTADEVTAQMHELSATYQELLDRGIARNLVNEKMLGDTEDMLELAKEYNIELPGAFEEMAASMRTSLKEATKDWDDLFERKLPKHINAMPGKVLPAMIKIGDDVATKLKGGLGKGFAEGLDDYTTNVKPQFENALNATWEGGFVGFGDELRNQIEVTLAWMKFQDWYVPVKPDPEIFNNAMQDLADGGIPDTRG